MSAMDKAGSFIANRALAYVINWIVDRILVRDPKLLDGLRADVEDDLRATEAKLKDWNASPKARQLGLTQFTAVVQLDLVARRHGANAILAVLDERKDT